MNCLNITQRTRGHCKPRRGNSINATVSITGAAKHTILKLLKDMGCACTEYHNLIVRNVRVRRMQRDEICAFSYAKEKNVPF